MKLGTENRRQTLPAARGAVVKASAGVFRVRYWTISGQRSAYSDRMMSVSVRCLTALPPVGGTCA